MKRTITIILFLLMNTAFIASGSLQAQCTNCRGAQSNPHYSSSAIGINTIAGGQASFASGFEAIANGQQSTSIGNMIQADGAQAMIFGSNANSFGSGAMVLGKGFGSESGERLTNNIDNSLMIGFTAEYESGQIVMDPAEILDAGWFDADHLPMVPEKQVLAGELIDWFVRRQKADGC